MLKCLCAWKMYIKARRIKTVVKRKSMQISERKIIRKYFALWVERSLVGRLDFTPVLEQKYSDSFRANVGRWKDAIML